MKKGFTMIELIFVIVILGVLASVAIPRLAATRDDAEAAKAATNLATAVSDITAYYTAKGKFEGDDGNKFGGMTSAVTDGGLLQVKGDKTCVTLTYPTKAQLAAGNDANITLTFTTSSADPVCTTLRKMSGIKSMCGEETGNTGLAKTPCQVQAGGSAGIKF